MASVAAMIRSSGRAMARAAPGLDGMLHAIYQRLPSSLHDTPTSFIGRYFSREAEVRFIQLGAHNGLQGDPIRELIADDPRWSGVLVEPNPSAFAELSKSYPDNGRIMLKRAAASDAPGQAAFYSFSPPDGTDPSELFDWWSEISSFDLGHVQRFLPERFHSAIRTDEVDVVTIAGIVAEFGLGRLDLLVMDIEGHEAAILRDLAGRPNPPRLIMFEHKHMTPAALADCTAWFRHEGYELKMYGRDAVLYAGRSRFQGDPGLRRGSS